jgi:hypothetical protein
MNYKIGDHMQNYVNNDKKVINVNYIFMCLLLIVSTVICSIYITNIINNVSIFISGILILFNFFLVLYIIIKYIKDIFSIILFFAVTNLFFGFVIRPILSINMNYFLLYNNNLLNITKIFLFNVALILNIITIILYLFGYNIGQKFKLLHLMRSKHYSLLKLKYITIILLLLKLRT